MQAPSSHSGFERPPSPPTESLPFIGHRKAGPGTRMTPPPPHPPPPATLTPNVHLLLPVNVSPSQIWKARSGKLPLIFFGRGIRKTKDDAWESSSASESIGSGRRRRFPNEKVNRKNCSFMKRRDNKAEADARPKGRQSERSLTVATGTPMKTKYFTTRTRRGRRCDK